MEEPSLDIACTAKARKQAETHFAVSFSAAAPTATAQLELEAARLGSAARSTRLDSSSLCLAFFASRAMFASLTTPCAALLLYGALI